MRVHRAAAVGAAVLLNVIAMGIIGVSVASAATTTVRPNEMGYDSVSPSEMGYDSITPHGIQYN